MEGESVKFHGIAQPTLHYMVASNLSKMSVQDDTQFFHLTIEKHVNNSTAVMGYEAPHPFVIHLQELLDQFDDIFASPTGLPPPRTLDHHIPLMPGASLPSFSKI